MTSEVTPVGVTIILMKRLLSKPAFVTLLLTFLHVFHYDCEYHPKSNASAVKLEWCRHAAVRESNNPAMNLKQPNEKEEK